MNGNHEVSSTGHTCRAIDSISSHLRVPLRDYGMVTIYMHEVEKTNLLGRNHRRSISNQDSSRLLRAVHGVHEMLSAHVDRVYDNRGALLMLFLAGQCLFVTALVLCITVSVALSD